MFIWYNPILNAGRVEVGLRAWINKTRSKRHINEQVPLSDWINLLLHVERTSSRKEGEEYRKVYSQINLEILNTSVAYI
jgi:hypothetical protein